MDQRFNELTAWTHEQLQKLGLIVNPQQALLAVSGDASFRRYYRVYAHQDSEPCSFVVMDAPPAKESCEAYIQVAQALEAQGLCVPHLFAINVEHGFLLLGDLGDELYLTHLNTSTADRMYELATSALLKIQQCEMLADQLPLYGEKLLRTEMRLFEEWFCDRLLHLSISPQEQALVNGVFALLIDSALMQPQVCVHRDYHSRNLMVMDKNSPGILDFQDAVKGAITYDLVSLFKDCYIAWPRGRVEQWVKSFVQQLRQQQTVHVTDDEFLRWFDWMGLQRHLKVLGIFSRLHLRDQKPRYLQDIPLVFDYVLETTSAYEEFTNFNEWLRTIVWPKWQTFYQQEVISS